ncbi:hypothetical protein HPB49_007164 [Dermacentor silvarum]|uniref:Uncharacterized protein n=1 Tax=Dermacentor silvarum TaxID=543639 RepID=A0ACB8C2J4_DERSI|nr:hypothetical protein HPB49_007164 [Dermacentor silvarum]
MPEGRAHEGERSAETTIQGDTDERGGSASLHTMCVESRAMEDIMQEGRVLDRGKAFEEITLFLMTHDPEVFRKYYRMTPETFEKLHSLLETRLSKQWVVREPVPSRCRLAITLRYLASGMQIQDVAMAFKVGISTTSNIVKEVCALLWDVLRPKCMKFPANVEQWQDIAKGFESRWDFPHCIGAVDGKHVQIEAPPHSGSQYFNYKGTYSIVLMAVVDSQLRFVCIDVGAYGSQSDGGVFKASQPNFSAKLLPQSTAVAPYVFVGDEAFQLRPDFLRPYPGRCLAEDLRLFNYRLSRARRCAENAFGVLASRFRIFRRPMNLLPENARMVTLAACALHNFLRDDVSYIPERYVDEVDTFGNLVEGQWRQEAEENAFLNLQHHGAHNYTKSAAETRDVFRNYFVHEGAVPWQRERCGLPP